MLFVFCGGDELWGIEILGFLDSLDSLDGLDGLDYLDSLYSLEKLNCAPQALCSL